MLIEFLRQRSIYTGPEPNSKVGYANKGDLFLVLALFTGAGSGLLLLDRHGCCWNYYGGADIANLIEVGVFRVLIASPAPSTIKK